MSKLEFTNTTYEPYGNCIKMANGVIELYVTCGFGPRIIHFSRVGMENVMYNDKEFKPLGNKFDIYNGDIIKLYGGHRLWVSPEIVPRCYHPDNGEVTVKRLATGVEFTAAIEKFNNIQKIMTVCLEEGSESVLIEHTIKNTGAWDITLAPWCITMLAAGGVEVMPQPNIKAGLLPNRNYTLWDYSKMNDSRVYWGQEYIILKQMQGDVQPFKFGYNNMEGWGAYFNKGQAFFKFFEPNGDGVYPDNGCCYETYTNNVMLEAETLGEIVIIPPGEETTHIEEWELYEESGTPSTDEKAVKKIIEKYIS